MPPPGPPLLLGRRRESELLDRLVASVRTGQSRALVIRGEAGIGKSALLDHLCDRATGCRVARVAGVEAERQLAFAGLQHLCAPFLSCLSRLPDPQAEALGVAFGLREGAAPSRFLVGLAVLGLLSEAAAERPLVCAIDDAQWLDSASAQALGFVARRLVAESVALIFALREHEHELTGVEELVLRGLDDADARALLDSVVPGPLDGRVRDRIVAETHGNPLALLELPRTMRPEEIAGGFGLAEAPAMAGRIEESFLRRLEELPDDTRRLVLIAAAEPLGDPVLILRAAERLGIDAGAVAPARAAGLLEFAGQVRFRHPLVRSALYHAATPEERRAAHGAIADATDPEIDPDRRAWHRADATLGLDEAVAAQLERSAERAEARGGLAAGAAFQERAAELTPTSRDRARRALSAAERMHRAGAPQASLRMLTIAGAGPLDELEQARGDLLRARLAFATTRGRDAPAMLLEAARRLAPFDAALARDTYLDAFTAALSAGRLAEGAGVTAVAHAAAAAAPGMPDGEVLEGLAVLATDGYGAAAPLLRQALAAFHAADDSGDGALRWLWLGCLIARSLSDAPAWDELTARHVRLARAAGALSLLPQALAERFAFELQSGDLAGALSRAAELNAMIAATGAPMSLNRDIWLAAWRGEADAAAALIAARRQDAVRRGEGQWLLATEHLTTMLLNGLGRYEEALAARDAEPEHPLDIGLATWVLPEIVEAAVRGGEPARAVRPLERLGEIARACDTDWALGLAARSRALVSEGDAAEDLYREAIDRLSRSGMRSAAARAELLYGEWLRREGRRTDSREHLRAAYEAFTDGGAHGFAERARRELQATGETVRKRTADTRDDLTAQEGEIARLAAGGATNPEIGAQLFLSPRTVEWHLRKVYGKLGISSRKQLGRALDELRGSPLPA